MNFPPSARGCHQKHPRLAKAATTKWNLNSVSAHGEEVVRSANDTKDPISPYVLGASRYMKLRKSKTLSTISGFCWMMSANALE
ncbi:hypothetical protein MCBRY_002306 [Methylocystis bryophila]